MRLKGWLRGDVSVSSLQGLRAAGAAAYSLAEEADSARQAEDWDPWTQGTSTQLVSVYTWNAFALQTTADQLVGDNAEASVEPSLFSFAQACYTQVQDWVESARLAQANPAFRTRTPLPTSLPPWPRFERTGLDELRTLRRVYDALAPRAEFEFGRVAAKPPPDKAGIFAEMKLVEAQMQTTVQVADGLNAHAHGPEQLREVQDSLVRALGCAFTLGQIAAMPSLTERLRLSGYRANPALPVPLTAVEPGWPVVDSSGAPCGTVAGLEGEPELGQVTAILLSPGATSANRRVHLDQLGALEAGLVRLAVAPDRLEPV